ncbi:MAG: UDP-N-acetylmuramoylalanine--D-glutamate ligase, partial [Parcubacteria group bacterium Greene0714_36]
ASFPASFKKTVDDNLGVHYRPSVALALAVGRHFGVLESAMKKTLAAFRGLDGRQEDIGVYGGIRFINDTTATIPDAAIAAITRFQKLAGKNNLLLIAGGQDKKMDFKKVAATIERSVNMLILLPGTATEKLKKELKKVKIKISGASSMKDAVHTAYRAAKKGDYVLLSPGAASFGLFLNEFDRGDQFTAEVKRLK